MCRKQSLSEMKSFVILLIVLISVAVAVAKPNDMSSLFKIPLELMRKAAEAAEEFIVKPMTNVMSGGKGFPRQKDTQG